jgi:hypothetical protein
MDPLEWLARLSDHIPAPGQHRTLFYGEYSNRVRGSGHPDDRETLAAAAILMSVGSVAAWLPAGRASRIDSARVLREG